jgi:hypothetical protein
MNFMNSITIWYPVISYNILIKKFIIINFESLNLFLNKILR